MIVVDTNVLVYTIIQMPQTALARQVATKDPAWIVPTLWRFEFTSSLTTLVRGHAIDVSQAEAAVTAADRLTAGREMSVDQTAALRAAFAYDLSAYDGQFIALAQSLNLRCVTADARMLRNAAATAISIADFVSGVSGP